MPKIKDVVHLAVLRKFIYRLAADLPEATRLRLDSIIRTYTRLYVA